MTAIAFEEGARFHRKSFVQDIAFDMAGGAELNLAGADAADHLAAHGDVIGQDFTMHFGLLADHKAMAADIAVHAAVNLHIAAGGEGAGHDQVCADDGGHAGARGLAGGGRQGIRVDGRGGRCVFASIRNGNLDQDRIQKQTRKQKKNEIRKVLEDERVTRGMIILDHHKSKL